MTRRIVFTVLLLAAALSSLPAGAHELHHDIDQAEAVVVRLTYGDGSPFSYESYELFFESEETPRQVGRTDAEGRVAFLPHRRGQWRLRAFSEDGHGVDLDFEAGPGATTPPGVERPGLGSRLITGVSIIFGIFGLIVLFFQRRSRG